MRVYLRRPELSDAKECIEAAKRSLALHRPWVFPALNAASWAEYIQRNDTPRHAGFLVCRRSDYRVAGVVNFNEIIRGAMDGAFVGYWAFEGMTGHGYMTEGLAQSFDQAFGALRLHRLEVNIQPGNLPSINLAKRLGLRLEGVSPRYLRIDGEWRDHERWAITAEDWAEVGGAAAFVARLGRA